MSIVSRTENSADASKKVEAVLLRTATDARGDITDEIAPYNPTDAERQVLSLVLKHFILGTTNAYTPRVEFNDLSLTARDQYDQMAFNTYQPNNGEAWAGDPQSAWRSRAIRPVIRNKCISIAAHATARLIFPKVFAFNSQSDEQKDAAMVMEDLMEWSGDISDYPFIALMRVITALSSPASIGYTEYGEVTRLVKTEKGEDGVWKEKRVRDEAYPCFMDAVVPVDQFYIENFFEPDIQKQGFLIWRKVYSYSAAQGKYNGVYDNFQYVRPGVQTIYDDANRNFYYVYDPNMRQEDVEEVIYWNKNLDLKLIMVNGVLLTDADNPNPRNDKLYPFDKFGYEPINNRFFYYKSLAFKLQHDAEIVNTLYQMVIDRTYLDTFKPMVAVGGEIIASDVIVPGAVTTLSDPNADLRAINLGPSSDISQGIKTLQLVEDSISESSQSDQQAGQKPGGTPTAYEISVLESNANTVLGLFLQMISKHVKDFGKLRMGDIVQYLTLPEVVDITGEPEMTYKTFFVGGKGNASKNKKIVFNGDMEDSYDTDEALNKSYELLDEGEKKKMEISHVNPQFFRELQYMAVVSPDILNPRSSSLERAFALEDFDRMIAQPMVFDPEETGKLLLNQNPLTMRDPDKYLVKQPPAGTVLPQPGQPAPNAMLAPGNAPLAAVKSPLSTPAPAPAMAGM